MQDQLDYNRIGMNASARYQSTMDDVVSEARGKRWARLVENIMTDYSDKAFGQEDSGKLSENRLAQARLMKERRILTMFPGSGSASDRSNAEATVISANSKIISLLKEELSLTEQIANKSIEGSKERVKLLEDQKKIQKELAEEAKNRFMTGKERFGNMTQTDQQKLIQTQQAFKYASELDRRGDAGSRMQAERIRASISAKIVRSWRVWA